MVTVTGPCRRPAPRPLPRMLRQMGRQHWDDGMMKDDYSCCSTESMVVPPRRRGCHGGERSYFFWCDFLCFFRDICIGIFMVGPVR